MRLWLSDLFGRKGGETGADKQTRRSNGKRTNGDGEHIAVEHYSAVGSRIGEENEALRNLLDDTGRKIGELDDLKSAFDKIVTPFNNTLRALEEEKSQNLSLKGMLSESRSAYETLRSEFYQIEKRATLLESPSAGRSTRGNLPTFPSRTSAIPRIAPGGWNSARSPNNGTTKQPATGSGARTVLYQPMRWVFLLVPLGGLLVVSVWFAIHAWDYLGGDPLPTYGYVAMAGGILFSLLVGCGLMALVFYSSRHGYDDLNDGDRGNDRPPPPRNKKSHRSRE